MFELSLLCPEDRVETVSDALDALDALSVSVEDADAQTDAEQALFGEPGMPPPKDGWQRSKVVALFKAEAEAEQARQLLQLQDFFEGCSVVGVVKVEEELPSSIPSFQDSVWERLKAPTTDHRWCIAWLEGEGMVAEASIERLPMRMPRSRTRAGELGWRGEQQAGRGDS